VPAARNSTWSSPEAALDDHAGVDVTVHARAVTIRLLTRN
jgi:hypothetical protein